MGNVFLLFLCLQLDTHIVGFFCLFLELLSLSPFCWSRIVVLTCVDVKHGERFRLANVVLFNGFTVRSGIVIPIRVESLMIFSHDLFMVKRLLIPLRGVVNSFASVLLSAIMNRDSKVMCTVSPTPLPFNNKHKCGSLIMLDTSTKLIHIHVFHSTDVLLLFKQLLVAHYNES